ncbi:MAG: class I SAM-dependent methyltransferase [Vicinamibacterales bacterium]
MIRPALAPQQIISAACEQDLLKYGDNFRGVGYTKSAAEAQERYALMLGVVREKMESVSLLDFGCGLGHLLDYLEQHPDDRHIHYSGLDISRLYLDAARARHPATDFVLMDVLESDDDLPEYDYAILNGVFNYRGAIAQASMMEYWRRLTAVVFRHCRRGLAFNAMSTIVDWQRDDLFHLPFEQMASFIGGLSRHFVVRHDYGAREYTTYVYRTPTQL